MAVRAPPIAGADGNIFLVNPATNELSFRNDSTGLGLGYPLHAPVIGVPNNFAIIHEIRKQLGSAITKCGHMLCQNGAECMVYGHHHYCRCSSYFSGPTCDKASDPCKGASNPCGNGTTPNCLTQVPKGSLLSDRSFVCLSAYASMDMISNIIMFLSVGLLLLAIILLVIRIFMPYICPYVPPPADEEAMGEGEGGLEDEDDYAGQEDLPEATAHHELYTNGDPGGGMYDHALNAEQLSSQVLHYPYDNSSHYANSSRLIVQPQQSKHRTTNPPTEITQSNDWSSTDKKLVTSVKGSVRAVSNMS